MGVSLFSRLFYVYYSNRSDLDELVLQGRGALCSVGTLLSWPGGHLVAIIPSTRGLAGTSGRDFEMNVDAVEERTGDPVAVTLDLDEAATAFALVVAVEAARTWCVAFLPVVIQRQNPERASPQ